MRFEGKSVIITGGGTGIGAAVARRMLAEGASVTLTGRRLDERDGVVEWALEARLVVEIDSRFVPLASDCSQSR